MRIYLDTTIQELFDSMQISARTYNCLRYAGMVTLEDVLNYAEYARLRRRNSRFMTRN